VDFRQSHILVRLTDAPNRAPFSSEQHLENSNADTEHRRRFGYGGLAAVLSGLIQHAFVNCR
jgi:hypothetical protein